MNRGVMVVKLYSNGETVTNSLSDVYAIFEVGMEETSETTINRIYKTLSEKYTLKRDDSGVHTKFLFTNGDYFILAYEPFIRVNRI